VTLNEILNNLKNVKGNGNKYTALCPAHEDKNSSLSISEDNGKTLIHCHAGCSTETIVQALGLKMNDLFTEEKEYEKPKIKFPKNGKPEAEYIYYDIDGNIVHKTIRYGKQYEKPFSQARPHPDKQGAWLYSLKGIKTVLYNLPNVIESIKEKKPIFIVEGEKDCDNLGKLGFTATTCPMGAGKWKDDYSSYLKNAIVYIVPDNDETGEKHAEQVSKSILKHAESIKILHLKEVYKKLPNKGDITDFFHALGKRKGIELLNLLMETSQEFKLSKSELEQTTVDDELNKLYEGTGYFVKDCKLWRSTSDGATLLADFVPIPISTLRKINGVSSEIYFKMQGRAHMGIVLPEVIISAEKLSSMQWIPTLWGYQANYSPGTAIKDYIRHAIACAGNNHATYEDIYTYTGWCKQGNEWVYLYNGGAMSMKKWNIR